MEGAESDKGTPASHHSCHAVALRLQPLGPNKARGTCGALLWTKWRGTAPAWCCWPHEREPARPGEPLHNYEAVLASVAIATHELGLHFSANKVRRGPLPGSGRPLRSIWVWVMCGWAADVCRVGAHLCAAAAR